MRRARAAALAVAGVVLLSAQSAVAVDWSTAQTVGVVTTEYVFTPKSLTFHSGVVYRLHLDNRGKETHEFTAPEFFKAIRMRNPKMLDADRVEIVIQPGEQKDLFFVAKTPGSYELTCSDHDWAGMVGDITIAP
jgi:uncharacterized cupredoxin-like copper-binding protein